MFDNLTSRITPRGTDFAEWYLDVIAAGRLARYSNVPGCFIIEPNGTELWEQIRATFDKRVRATGHRNMMYPTLIPESFIKREADHLDGFAPELARVRELHGEPLADPLVLRPTSETVIYDDWSRQVKSISDLPVKMNQWGNVFRVERRTRPFLRTFEFYWQEGHTAHAGEDEAREHTQRMLSEYERFMSGHLAMPSIPGRKTELERFAGAAETYSIETMMQDGKALQAATSHYIGTKFAAAFGVQFQAADNTFRPVHTTSWGMSTRIIGAIIMTHGDDRGLVLPPRIAPTQAVILLINDKRVGSGTEYEVAYNGLKQKLSNAGIRVEVDDTDDRLGEKHFHWEKLGTPLRVVYGPAELKSGSVVVVRRDTGDRQAIAIDNAADTVLGILDKMHDEMFKRALDRLHLRIHKIDAMAELQAALAGPNAFFATGWCGEFGLEEQMKRDLGLTIRCMPLEPLTSNSRCFMTGLPAAHQVLIGKAY